jgi:hypothetical protein
MAAHGLKITRIDDLLGFCSPDELPPDFWLPLGEYRCSLNRELVAHLAVSVPPRLAAKICTRVLGLLPENDRDDILGAPISKSSRI